MELLIVILVVLAVLLVAGLAFFFRQRSGRVAQPQTPVSRDRSLGERDSSLDAPAARRGATPAATERSTASDAASDTAVGEAGVAEPEVAEPEVALEPDPEPEPERPATFRERLSKARNAFTGYIGSALSRSDITEQTWEELEEALILADVGLPTTMAVLDRVRSRVAADKVTTPEPLLDMLKEELVAEAGGRDITLQKAGEPAVWLFVGVNGVGKTTTIGKLAHRETKAGVSVVLGAGDTFRAAAAEQLEMWADRAGAGFIRGAEGADPGSVVFDTVEHAASQSAQLVLADTAGRLHNKSNLMEELKKVRRVAEKASGQVTEVLLVIDATTGQNGLVQARQFAEAVNVTGVVLTKLDGSAKGGIVLAIQNELGIPVKLVGLGEGILDLVEFDAHEFVEALFA